VCTAHLILFAFLLFFFYFYWCSHDYLNFFFEYHFNDIIDTYLLIVVYYFNFSRFDDKDSVIGIQQLKSSVQKGIRTKILDQYPTLEEYIDMILPKKDALRIVKW